MQYQKAVGIPDEMWRKCGIAGTAAMGGSSAAAFVRAAIKAALDELADHDAVLRTQFAIVDAGGIEPYIKAQESRELVTA